MLDAQPFCLVHLDFVSSFPACELLQALARRWQYIHAIEQTSSRSQLVIWSLLLPTSLYP